jgi:DNA topoisomerase-1
MLEPVAEALGNTPAISRKSYVHPALIDAVKAGAERGLIAFLDKPTRRKTKAS